MESIRAKWRGRFGRNPRCELWFGSGPVAFSFAANHPNATKMLTMLDVPHPDESLLSWPMLPAHGKFGDKIDEAHLYVWWFAFHQVKGMPEELLAL